MVIPPCLIYQKAQKNRQIHISNSRGGHLRYKYGSVIVQRSTISPQNFLSSLSLAMALPFIPVSPRRAARNIATKMGFVRQGLISRGEYLADPAIVERVGWEQFGSGHHLVVLPLPSPSPTNREATPFPDGSGAAIENTANASPTSTNNLGASPSPEPAGDVPAKPSVPATLSIVTQLVPGQSWLYPDARWTSCTKYVQKFTDVKLLCTGGAATHARFANDHAAAILNLNAIMGQVGDTHNERNTIISGPANYIRVRHPLFTVCPIRFLIRSLHADLWISGIRGC